MSPLPEHTTQATSSLRAPRAHSSLQGAGHPPDPHLGIAFPVRHCFSSSSLPPPHRDLFSLQSKSPSRQITTNTIPQVLWLDPESCLFWSGFRLLHSEVWSRFPVCHIPHLRQRAWKSEAFRFKFVCWGGEWEGQSKANVFSCHSPDLKCPWHSVHHRRPSWDTKLEPAPPLPQAAPSSTGQRGCGQL